MELLNDKGEPIKKEQEIPVGKGLLEEAAVQGLVTADSTIKSIKESDRRRSKNLTGHHRSFSSQSDMEEQAEKIYAKHGNKIKEEYESDVKNGLDIKNPESIKNFDIEYTPIGNSLVIKELHEELKEGSLILPNGLGDDKKGIVMVPGLLVTTLKRGDVVALKPTPQGQLMALKREFNGVKFVEIEIYAVAGVCKREAEMQDRLKEMWANYKQNQ